MLEGELSKIAGNPQCRACSFTHTELNMDQPLWPIVFWMGRTKIVIIFLFLCGKKFSLLLVNRLSTDPGSCGMSGS